MGTEALFGRTRPAIHRSSQGSHPIQKAAKGSIRGHGMGFKLKLNRKKHRSQLPAKPTLTRCIEGSRPGPRNSTRGVAGVQSTRFVEVCHSKRMSESTARRSYEILNDADGPDLKAFSA
jgi:hypothetical protein